MSALKQLALWKTHLFSTANHLKKINLFVYSPGCINSLISGLFSHLVFWKLGCSCCLFGYSKNGWGRKCVPNAVCHGQEQWSGGGVEAWYQVLVVFFPLTLERFLLNNLTQFVCHLSPFGLKQLVCTHCKMTKVTDWKKMSSLCKNTFCKGDFH